MSELPTHDEIIAYITQFMRQNDGAPTRRDLAKAFKVKGPDRSALRRLLNAMEDAGKISLDGKRATVSGSLPPVLVVDVVDQDADGDLICTPVKAEIGEHQLILTSAQAGRFKPAIGVGNRFLGRLTAADGDDGALLIAPLKVLGKGTRKMLCIFEPSARGGGHLTPVNRKSGNALLVERGDDKNAKAGDLVWAEPKNARGYGPKRARITEILGDAGASENWSMIALAEQEIPIDFPEAVTKESESATPPDTDTHPDRSDIPFITIDPSTAKDHDDAVYAKFDEDGFTVFVAIADVSWFVRPGTALDQEAQKRGNSVYLVDRVVPMLPERLSNDLCSLREDVPRPALCCEMRYDLNGRKTDHSFFRAMITCQAGLSYEEAQAARDGELTDRTRPYKESTIDPLYEAYARMTEAKAAKPSLDLDLPERAILLNDKGQVDSVRAKDRLDAHKLIETMMVAANVCAAESLEAAQRPLIYRVHDAPNEERVDALRQYLVSQDYSLPKGQVLTPLAFNRILSKAADRGEIDLISMAILRAQSQAIYDTQNLGHFGLNLARYAHFTSPIRRYADLTIHRGLVSAGKLGPGGHGNEEETDLGNVAEAISLTERRAIAAERSTNDRFLAAYLAPQVGASFPGRISGATASGLFVALDETGADGFVPMRTLEGDYYVFDEERQSIIGRRSGEGYRLGMKVDVTLLEVTPVQGGLRFHVETPPQPLGDTSRRRGRKPLAKGKRPRRGASSKPGGPKPKGPLTQGHSGGSSSGRTKSDHPAGSGATLTRRPRKKT